MNNRRIEYVFIRFDNADFDEFAYREFYKLVVLCRPHLVAFRTEIFETDPNFMLGVFHHVRRPVVEYLNSAEFYVSVLNVYPAIGNDIVKSFYLSFVFNFEFIEQKTYGDEISVRKFGCDAVNVVARLVLADSLDKIFYRHGRNEIIAFIRYVFAVFVRDESGYLSVFGYNLFNCGIFYNLSAEPLDFSRHFFIELPGTLFRIIILLYKACFNLIFLFAEGFGKGVCDRLSYRQAFNSLRAPVRRNVARVNAPELLGVIHEKHFVKRFAETVDVKVFEVVLFSFMNTASDITEARLHRAEKAHVYKRPGFERNGIIEKLPQKDDTRNSVSQKHYVVRLFGIGSAFYERLFAP